METVDGYDHYQMPNDTSILTTRFEQPQNELIEENGINQVDQSDINNNEIESGKSSGQNFSDEPEQNKETRNFLTKNNQQFLRYSTSNIFTKSNMENSKQLSEFELQSNLLKKGDIQYSIDKPNDIEVEDQLMTLKNPQSLANDFNQENMLLLRPKVQIKSTSSIDSLKIRGESPYK